VLPVPGGPTSRTPLGGSMPTLRYSSGFRSGSSTASRSSRIWPSRPPTSSYETGGFPMISAPVTLGSRDGGRTPLTAKVCFVGAVLDRGGRLWHLLREFSRLVVVHDSDRWVGSMTKAICPAFSTESLRGCFPDLRIVQRPRRAAENRGHPRDGPLRVRGLRPL